MIDNKKVWEIPESYDSCVWSVTPTSFVNGHKVCDWSCLKFAELSGFLHPCVPRVQPKWFNDPLTYSKPYLGHLNIDDGPHVLSFERVQILKHGVGFGFFKLS